MTTKVGPTVEVEMRANRIAMLVGREGKGIAEIRRLMGISEEQARRAIEVAIERGKIERVGTTSATKYRRITNGSR